MARQRKNGDARLGGNQSGIGNGDNGRRASMSAREHTTDGSGSQAARVVLFNSKGQHTASIDPDRVLRKTVIGSKHRLRQPYPAWAFDVAHVEAAEAARCEWVEVFDKEDSRTYRARLSDFRRYGALRNYGYGPQLALGIGRFHIERPPADDAPVQLSLFGAAA